MVLVGVKTFKELLNALRAQLRTAHDEGLLRTPSHDIYKWVRRNDEPEADEEILGGVKSSRDPADAHLVRDDGAWIHFKIRVRQEDRSTLMAVAFDFEIVFPEPHTPPWLRFDLNPPGHSNEERELRSHLHPGNDDILVRALEMTPQAILDQLVRGLRPRDPGRPRA